nr:hypothetical protein [Phenylobacterium deserti]
MAAALVGGGIVLRGLLVRDLVELVIGGQSPVRRRLVYCFGQDMGEFGQQALSGNARLFLQILNRVFPKGVGKLMWGEGLVLTGADPRVHLLAIALLLQLPDQSSKGAGPAEPPEKRAKTAASAEDSAQSTKHSAKAAAVRSGASRRIEAAAFGGLCMLARRLDQQREQDAGGYGLTHAPSTLWLAAHAG